MSWNVETYGSSFTAARSVKAAEPFMTNRRLKESFHTPADLDMVRGTQATTSRKELVVPNSKVTFSLRFTVTVHACNSFYFCCLLLHVIALCCEICPLEHEISCSTFIAALKLRLISVHYQHLDCCSPHVHWVAPFHAEWWNGYIVYLARRSSLFSVRLRWRRCYFVICLSHPAQIRTR